LSEYKKTVEKKRLIFCKKRSEMNDPHQGNFYNHEVEILFQVK